MNKTTVGILAIAALFVGGLGLWFLWTFAAGVMGAALVGSTAAPVEPGRWQLLIEGEGQSDDVSRPFTVPDDCPRQVLEWGGVALDFDVSWANYQAITDDGRGVEAVMGDFNRAPAGETAWRLEPGRYVSGVQSWDADWRYRLECR